MAELLGDRYRLIDKLGQGGMAEVWHAHDEVLGRAVAVKLLGPELAADPAFVERLRVEARAAARLSHPNITSVHDYGQSGGRAFVVMELLEGQTLRSALEGGRSLPWRRAVAVCASVAAALAEAHARGIVHRDVSSSNVMLTPGGVKVFDFGISALIGEHESGDLLGTPEYVAPERLSENAEITPALDVYAVGVLLYRCLRGELPWAAETATGLLDAHLGSAPAPLPPLLGVPKRVAELCYRCLAKDPADRPGSAGLAAELARLAGRQPLPALAAGAGALTNVLASRRLKPAVGGKFATGVVVLGKPAEKVTAIIALPRKRKVLIGAGSSLALAAAAVLLFSGKPTQQGRWAEARGETVCQVTYALSRDDGRSFDANVTLHNTGRSPVAPWELRFALPGDQNLVAAQSVSWQQEGQAVTVKPDSPAPLAAGAEHTFALSGQYDQVNAMPAGFTVGGVICAATVVGAKQPPPVAIPAQAAAGPAEGPAVKGPAGKPGKGKPKPKGGGDDDDDEGDDD
jgi:hypothetical protein